eukprot:1177-Prymnesium_polylepis.1
MVRLVSEQDDRLVGDRAAQRARGIVDDSGDRVVAHAERIAAADVHGHVAADGELQLLAHARRERLHRRRRGELDVPARKIGRIPRLRRWRTHALVGDNGAREVAIDPGEVHEVGNQLPFEGCARIGHCQRRRHLRPE